MATIEPKGIGQIGSAATIMGENFQVMDTVFTRPLFDLLKGGDLSSEVAA